MCSCWRDLRVQGPPWTQHHRVFCCIRKMVETTTGRDRLWGVSASELIELGRLSISGTPRSPSRIPKTTRPVEYWVGSVLFGTCLDLARSVWSSVLFVPYLHTFFHLADRCLFGTSKTPTSPQKVGRLRHVSRVSECRNGVQTEMKILPSVMSHGLTFANHYKLVDLVDLQMQRWTCPPGPLGRACMPRARMPQAWDDQASRLLVADQRACEDRRRWVLFCGGCTVKQRTRREGSLTQPFHTGGW